MLNRKQLEDSKNCKVTHDCDECEIRSTFPTHCVQAVGQTALALLDMLKRLEFAYNSMARAGKNVCQICGYPDTVGHYKDCELGNLLKEMEG